MSKTTRSVFAAIVAVASCQATTSAGIIFSNVVSGNPNRGLTTTSAPQLGGEITAAPGTSRTVTELQVGFNSQNVPVTADLQAFLYANNGGSGTPGTLLWSSAVISGVTFDSFNTLFSFAVSSVLVPDTFTFATAITNATGVLGYVPASGATTGTFDQAYVGSPGAWQPLPAGFETEAQIITGTAAVPEPSSIALAVSSAPLVAGCWLLRRRRAA